MTDKPVIDAQVHAYEANHPGRPWVNKFMGPEHVTGDDMVAAMDSVGVDGAILVSTFITYRYDPSYALEVYAKHPERFAVVRPIDTTDPAVADVVADWATQAGAVGLRVMLNFASPDPADLGLNRALAAAAKHNQVVNLLMWDQFEQAEALIMRNPDTVIVIDHLGLRQPPHPSPEPWTDLPKVLSLARYDNVRMKLTGACTLSHEPFPYDDIWDPVLRLIDAYGLDRCMWGTDWTRATQCLTYEQGVDAFRTTARLSQSEKARLMGGTLAQVYGWAPSRP
jgi:predicted TIM-barrel fold metal-dependent hydrolase